MFMFIVKTFWRLNYTKNHEFIFNNNNNKDILKTIYRGVLSNKSNI
jgi:hypothetical protein